MISRSIPFIALITLFSAPLVAKPPLLTLENLHTLTLNPTNSIAGKKVKFIPQWFERMKNKGIPQEGIAFVPTNTISCYWHFKKGIPANQKDPIFIHSGPHDGFWDRLVHGRTGHGMRCTHAWLKHSIVNGTFVTFDYLYDRKDFDFGQGINIQALSTVHSQINQSNPQAPLIIAATCVGAKIAWEFTVAHNPKNLAALILETPFIDADKFIANLGKNYMGWLPFATDSKKGNIIKSITQWYAPHVTDTLSQPHANLAKMNPELPIFIAHLKDDSMYSDNQMKELITELKKSGNKNIYLLVIKDSKTKHGHLNQKPEFAQAANAFLAQHNLPHNAQLAQEGAALLADAKYNADASSTADWRIVESEKIG